MGAKTTATVAGFATSGNDSVFYCIELDAEYFVDYPWVRLQFTDPGASTIGSAVAILSGGRYGSSSTPTAIV